jgi:hypothetical protein
MSVPTASTGSGQDLRVDVGRGRGRAQTIRIGYVSVCRAAVPLRR